MWISEFARLEDIFYMRTPQQNEFMPYAMPLMMLYLEFCAKQTPSRTLTAMMDITIHELYDISWLSSDILVVNCNTYVGVEGEENAIATGQCSIFEPSARW